MQTALAIEDEGHRRSRRPNWPPQLLSHRWVPEQIPLLRMLEIVRGPVESIHASHRAVTAELREIKANLPAQRRSPPARTQAIHVGATWASARRNGVCPGCQTEPVCTDTERLESAEFDHWYSRNQNRAAQAWLVCGECNRRLLDTDYKASARSAFGAYQQALGPVMGARQISLVLSNTEAA
jgi:hypothetical protein